MTDVVVTAVFQAATDHRDDLIAALKQGIPAVHDEPGCILYAIHDADDDSIVMLEKWSSRAELEAHAGGVAVKQLNALVGPFLAAPPVVTTMSALPAGTTDQGLL